MTNSFSVVILSPVIKDSVKLYHNLEADMPVPETKITENRLIESLDFLIESLHEFYFNYAEGLIGNSRIITEEVIRYREWFAEVRDFSRKYPPVTEGDKKSLQEKLERASSLIGSLP